MNQNKIVLVTGCSSGIGRDICNILTNQGYTVVASARNINKLETVSASLRLELDVTDKASITLAINQIVKEYGQIDILVNNAGYSIRGALEEVEVNKLQKMFDVNVFGIINMIQFVLPYMRQHGNGKIVNIGSISGKFSQSLNGGYCASKHAVEAINDALRLELHDFDIQSTVIEPGAMQTNFFNTLSLTSDTLMENQQSPYRNLYIGDINYRKEQKRMDSIKAAEKICNIIEKEKLKPRYTVAVPFLFKILLALPDNLKEAILLRH
ncbi:SDR family oxidoreductase [Anaerosporobacter sp.]